MHDNKLEETIQPEPMSIVAGPQTARIMYVSPNHLYYVQLDGVPLPESYQQEIDGAEAGNVETFKRTQAEQLDQCHLFVVGQRGLAMCEVNTATDINPFQLAERIASLLDAREMCETSGALGISETCDTIDAAAVKQVMEWGEER